MPLSVRSCSHPRLKVVCPDPRNVLGSKGNSIMLPTNKCRKSAFFLKQILYSEFFVSVMHVVIVQDTCCVFCTCMRPHSLGVHKCNPAVESSLLDIVQHSRSAVSACTAQTSEFVQIMESICTCRKSVLMECFRKLMSFQSAYRSPQPNTPSFTIRP